jgi:hypothetical protein
MSISINDYARVYRTLDIPVTYLAEDDEEKQETLHIKYRPIQQSWIDGWQETSERLTKDVTQQTEECISSAFRAANEIISVNTNGSTPQTTEEKALFLAALLAVVNARMDLTEEQKAEGKKLKARQLSTILIDVDMVDPESKKKVQPTEEFLGGLDLEFLNEVGEGILKKTYRIKAT